MLQAPTVGIQPASSSSTKYQGKSRSPEDLGYQPTASPGRRQFFPAEWPHPPKLTARLKEWDASSAHVGHRPRCFPPPGAKALPQPLRGGPGAADHAGSTASPVGRLLRSRQSCGLRFSNRDPQNAERGADGHDSPLLLPKPSQAQHPPPKKALAPSENTEVEAQTAGWQR